MRAHELMSSIQYDGKAMLTNRDESKVEVLITTEIVNEALHFYLGTYDLIAKTKSIDNEKAFLKAKGSKFKYLDMIYSELELPLRLKSQHFWVQKPLRYVEPLLHMAVVMALCVVDKRHIKCNYGKFILESLIEANLKNPSKNKLYMSARPMLTRIAYQALGMIKDLPVAGSQASLIQHARYVPKAVKATPTSASSRTTRSTKKSSSDEERTDTDKDQDSKGSDQEDNQKGAEAPWPSEHEWKQQASQLAREKIKEALRRKAEGPILEPREGIPKRPRQEDEDDLENIQADPLPSTPKSVPPAPPSPPKTPVPPPSSPKTPPSPKFPEVSKSPPAPASPQQQQHTAEPPLVPPSSQPKDDPAKEIEDQEKKQADTIKPKPAGQFQCQKIVTKETDFQKERTDQAYEEIENLWTALQLVTKERDSDAQENENILKDLLDVHSQLDRKETQCHELVKNEKKLKEQLSATMNTLTALQEELQTEKLQRQLLVSRFMTETAQHEARVKELEQELAQAKAEPKI
ncbi:hypothetical protein L7F22_004752 [Adiantum nelumboides]|nr:hypothetical protein [Adiantum nelumboides]